MEHMDGGFHSRGGIAAVDFTEHAVCLRGETRVS
jgi:hypothetical protein